MSDLVPRATCWPPSQPKWKGAEPWEAAGSQAWPLGPRAGCSRWRKLHLSSRSASVSRADSASRAAVAPAPRGGRPTLTPGGSAGASQALAKPRHTGVSTGSRLLKPLKRARFHPGRGRACWPRPRDSPPAAPPRCSPGRGTWAPVGGPSPYLSAFPQLCSEGLDCCSRV